VAIPSAIVEEAVTQGCPQSPGPTQRPSQASLALTSNLPFYGWVGVFGDQAVAAAMIDRIVHQADVLTLKGASYRLRGRGIDSLPSIRTQNQAD
jgi:IstB-like ATP binding protein